MTRPSGTNVVREQAQYEGLFDPLTGLPTRALVLDRIHMAQTRALRTHRTIAVFALAQPRMRDGRSLDMVEFAYHLRSKVRSDDTVARVGPDTFVVVCNDMDELGDDASALVERFLGEAGVTCRFGAVLGEVGDVPEQLVDRAIAHAAGP